jgi:hypothetical protein
VLSVDVAAGGGLTPSAIQQAGGNPLANLPNTENESENPIA